MHISKHTTQITHSHTGFTHKERHIPRLTKEKQTNLTYVHTHISTEKHKYPVTQCRNRQITHISMYTHPISKDTQHKQITHTKTHNMQTSHHTHTSKHTYTNVKRNVKTNYPHVLTHISKDTTQTNHTHTHTHTTKKSQIHTGYTHSQRYTI